MADPVDRPRGGPALGSAPMIDPERVAQAVYEGIRLCATNLRPDCYAAFRCCSEAAAQRGGREASVLASIIENADIGRANAVPICQDTGSVWVCLEVGEEAVMPGNALSKVNEAVARAYVDGKLRMSILEDALFDRTNTGDNAPAFCDIDIIPGRSVKLHVLLKGGGSDNASRLVMLPPSAGEEGVIEEILRCVQEKAANACPPLVIGVGVGATFDKVASLAKHALLRPVGSSASSPEAAAFEERVLLRVNGLGIGAGALGGNATAVAVHLSTAPCHIAALPVAINMGCCAMRSCTFVLADEEGRILANPTLLEPTEGMRP